MASVGEVIFSREVDDSSDLWDDTALIKAYDDAVNTMKAQLAQSLDDNSEANVPPSLPNLNKKKHKKNRRKHRKKDKSAEQHVSPSPTRFKVGSHCRAVFTEDGQTYEAVVISVDPENEMCRVRYLGYGNEEDQLLNDLLPSKEYDVSISDVPSECDSLPGSMRGGMSQKQSQFKVPFQHDQHPRRMMTGEWPPTSPPRPPLPPLCNMGQGFLFPPMMPPLFPPTPGTGVPSFPNGLHPMEIPMPPSIDDEDLLNTDSEALHSMLISWYMSGYHTGYYQGLKEGKKLKVDRKIKNETADLGQETDGTR